MWWWFDSFYRTLLGPAGTGATRGYALEFRFGGQLCHAYPPSFIRALPLSLWTLSPEPSHKHSISIKLTLFKGLTGYRYSTIVTSGSPFCLFSLSLSLFPLWRIKIRLFKEKVPRSLKRKEFAPCLPPRWFRGTRLFFFYRYRFSNASLNDVEV